jgi:hypothetical protein
MGPEADVSCLFSVVGFDFEADIPGRQDHTTSPSAASSLVRAAAPRRCRVHRIPNPTSVTIAKHPSIGNGMARDKPVTWVKWKERYS